MANSTIKKTILVDMPTVTLGDSVINGFNSTPIHTIKHYWNSNMPTGNPGHGYGGYLFFRSTETRGVILYYDTNEKVAYITSIEGDTMRNWIKLA